MHTPSTIWQRLTCVQLLNLVSVYYCCTCGVTSSSKSLNAEDPEQPASNLALIEEGFIGFIHWQCTWKQSLARERCLERQVSGTHSVDNTYIHAPLRYVAPWCVVLFWRDCPLFKHKAFCPFYLALGKYLMSPVFHGYCAPLAAMRLCSIDGNWGVTAIRRKQ